MANTHYLSGEAKSEAGTAAIEKYHEYNYFNSYVTPFIQEQKKAPTFNRITKIPANEDGATRSIIYYNMWNSPIQQIVPCPGQPAFTNFSFYANEDENLTSTESPNVNPSDFLHTAPIQKYYSYDSENHQNASWLFIDGSQGHDIQNLAPNEASHDRLTKIEAVYTNLSGAWFRVTNTYLYLTDQDGTATRVSSVRKRLNGFASGVKSEMTAIDVHSNTVITTTYVDRPNKKITQSTTSPSSTLAATNILINGLLQSQSTFSVAAPTLFSYDSLRRQIAVATPAGGTTVPKCTENPCANINMSPSFRFGAISEA